MTTSHECCAVDFAATRCDVCGRPFRPLPPVPPTAPQPVAEVIVTRHPALVKLLHERHPSLVAGADVLTHISDPEQIRGRHVVGVLPLHLAAEAASLTEIPLSLAPDDRGRELSIRRLREVAGEPITYTVLAGRWREQTDGYWGSIQVRA